MNMMNMTTVVGSDGNPCGTQDDDDAALRDFRCSQRPSGHPFPSMSTLRSTQPSASLA